MLLFPCCRRSLITTRVEKASEFAVSEVFSNKKSHAGIRSQAVALQSIEQLQDHDEAYDEAQAVLSEWMGSMLRLELGVDEEDDIIGSSNNNTEASVSRLPSHSAVPQYTSFNDMYADLEQEEESSVVSSFLRELMEREVLDGGALEELSLDSSERARRRARDPGLTMEVRHKQVKENRRRRDAERERERREREAQREAREEAQRRLREEERRRLQEERREEELLQQEAVRLRREMEARRGAEQLARRMEREQRDRAVKQRAAQAINPAVLPLRQQHTGQLVQQRFEARVHMLNLQCLQRHFSAWVTLVLARRMRQGKAAALCDWRRKLRAWRAWRAMVWANREEREAEKTQEELRLDNRRHQVAAESDRRRLLRRCLNDWQVWCRMERERRELLEQQDETKRKMAALLSTAASGRLRVKPSSPQPITDPPEKSSQSEDTDTQVPHQTLKRSDRLSCTAVSNLARLSSPCQAAIPCPGTVPTPTPTPAPVPAPGTAAAAASSLIVDDGARGDARGRPPPKQAWQVTRRHAALSTAELPQLAKGEARPEVPQQQQQPRQLNGAPSGPGGRFEHRHAAQQQVIAEQRRRLMEQQEVIARLQETQSMAQLHERAATQQSHITTATQRPLTHPRGPTETHSNVKALIEPNTDHTHPQTARPQGFSREANMLSATPRNPLRKHTAPHPAVQAPRQRVKPLLPQQARFREGQWNHSKPAQLKAAEEERERMEEEERRLAAEKRKEERRRQKERELEKQRKVEREQKLVSQAKEHYQRSLLLRRGLAPWRRFLELCHANTQVAVAHHGHLALRRSFLLWYSTTQQRQQHRQARATHHHTHTLLRACLTRWRRLKDYRWFLEERAERFCRERVLRRVFGALLLT
ncbi:hypothetical protein ACEWY4_018460 [Coilia grayii]|uniref:Uncharacterized protein n=1 Tax=Coilia grayii TaxID=363190 RepID=A0ABD1JFI5_9TELE